MGIEEEGLSVHALRATAAIDALGREADIAKVQEWLGHTNIATMRDSTIGVNTTRRTARDI